VWRERDERERERDRREREIRERDDSMCGRGLTHVGGATCGQCHMWAVLHAGAFCVARVP